MAKTVDLDFFIGREFDLSGVDFTIIPDVEDDKDVNVINFILDGVAYGARENPSDGYRSSLDDIVIHDVVTASKIKMFPPCRVRAEANADPSQETVIFRDVMTNLPVIEVGTSRSDEWYPSFVSMYKPENMITNRAVDGEAELTNMQKAQLSEFLSGMIPIEADRGPDWGSF